MIPTPRQDWTALDLTSPLVSEPEPPAALETLAWAQYLSLAVLSTPYPNALKCFDGVSANLTARRITQVVGPGCNQARFATTRYGRGPKAMPAAKVSTSTGGLGVYSDAPSTVQGVEGYLELDKQEGSSTVDRTLNLPTRSRRTTPPEPKARRPISRRSAPP